MLRSQIPAKKKTKTQMAQHASAPLLVALAVLALSCRSCDCQAVDPISGQPISGQRAPAPPSGRRQQGSPQRRYSGATERKSNTRRVLDKVFGEAFGTGEGSSAGGGLPNMQMSVAETLIGVFTIMVCGIFFSGVI